MKRKSQRSTSSADGAVAGASGATGATPLRTAALGLLVSAASVSLLCLFTLGPNSRHGPSLSQRLEAFWPKAGGLLEVAAWALPLGALVGGLSHVLAPLRVRHPAACAALFLAGAAASSRVGAGVAPEVLDRSTVWMAPSLALTLFAASSLADLVADAWARTQAWLRERYQVTFASEFEGALQRGLLALGFAAALWVGLEWWNHGWSLRPLVLRARVFGPALMLLVVTELPKAAAARALD